MALNQTDSHSYPVFTLTSTLRGPKAIDITHLFTYTPPPLAQDLAKTSPMIPVFNHDLRHFTPAFILPSDEVIIAPFRTTTTSTRSSKS